jgi:hypothetical protein
MKDARSGIELFSNRNFVRKWGIMIPTFNQLGYQTKDNFTFKKVTMSLHLNDMDKLSLLEPFFDKIVVKENPKEYIDSEQPTTRYNLTSKFEDVDNVDVIISHINELTQEDLNLLTTIRLNVSTLEPGQYSSSNLVIDVKNKV